MFDSCKYNNDSYALNCNMSRMLSLPCPKPRKKTREVLKYWANITPRISVYIFLLIFYSIPALKINFPFYCSNSFHPPSKINNCIPNQMRAQHHWFTCCCLFRFLCCFGDVVYFCIKKITLNPGQEVF